MSSFNIFSSLLSLESDSPSSPLLQLTLRGHRTQKHENIDDQVMKASSSASRQIPEIIESRSLHPVMEVISHERAKSVATEPSRHAKIPVIQEHYYFNETHAYRVLQVSAPSDIEKSIELLKNMKKMRGFGLWEYWSCDEDKLSGTFKNALLANLVSKREDRK